MKVDGFWKRRSVIVFIMFKFRIVMLMYCFVADDVLSFQLLVLFIVLCVVAVQIEVAERWCSRQRLCCQSGFSSQLVP